MTLDDIYAAIRVLQPEAKRPYLRFSIWHDGEGFRASYSALSGATISALKPTSDEALADLIEKAQHIADQRHSR